MLAFELKELVLGIISGDTRSMARALSLTQSNSDEAADKLLQQIYPYGGNSRIIGITGATGVGKSSLIFQAAKILRRRNRSVGIISIDPTSPVSGGAFLGDRLRMQELALNDGVFIRSVAGGRGSVDSLTKKIFSLVHVMEASGKHYVFVETIGSGQNDCLIAKVAQTTVYVSIPTLGDEIQAMKAGILELTDIVVVNRADDPNKDKALIGWKNVLGFEEKKPGAWKVPALAVDSLSAEGAEDLVDAIDNHERHMKDSGEWERRKQDSVREEIRMTLKTKLLKAIEGIRISDKDMGALLERRLDPVSYSSRLLKRKH